MNCIVNQNIQARNECINVSKVSRWFISPQNQAPLVGAFQDGLIGIAEATKDGLKANKWHAMNMLADIDSYGAKLDSFNFKDKSYTLRSLVSRLLPEINLTNRKPSIYKQEYATLMKYNP